MNDWLHGQFVMEVGYSVYLPMAWCGTGQAGVYAFHEDKNGGVCTQVDEHFWVSRDQATPLVQARKLKRYYKKYPLQAPL